MEDLKIQEDYIKDIKVVGGGQIPIAVFYDEKKYDAFITEFKSFVESVDRDISTAEGRKNINSMAYEIARMKKPIEEAGKATIEEVKAKVKAVDKQRIKLVDTIEEIQIKFRKPLTDFENKEKERVAKIEQAYKDLETLGDFSFDIPTIENVTLRLNQANVIVNRDWEEFKDKALEAHVKLVNKLHDMTEKLIKEKAEREELEQLRKEQEVRKQAEREAQIAEEARENARREAIAEARRVELENQKKADEAAQRLQKIEEEKLALIKKAKEDAEKAEKDKQAAIEAERKRIKDQQDAEAKETAKREANKAHKKRINNEALEDIIALGIDKDLAKALITAIVEEKVRNINIRY